MNTNLLSQTLCIAFQLPFGSVQMVFVTDSNKIFLLKHICDNPLLFQQYHGNQIVINDYHGDQYGERALTHLMQCNVGNDIQNGNLLDLIKLFNVYAYEGKMSHKKILCTFQNAFRELRFIPDIDSMISDILNYFQTVDHMINERDFVCVLVLLYTYNQLRKNTARFEFKEEASNGELDNSSLKS